MTLDGRTTGKRVRVMVHSLAEELDTLCALCPATDDSMCEDCAEWLWVDVVGNNVVHSDEPMFGKVNRSGFCIED